MPDLAFTVPGKPFAKQRPRMTRAGRVYTPAATVSFEQTVAQYAMQAGAVATTEPVAVSILAVFEPPKSWSKARRAASLGAPHTQRPDLDNCEKAVLDGLNRVAFADDGQVFQLTSRKVWGEPARTEVEVRKV